MVSSTAALLKEHGIHPSAQRVAIAQFVLRTDRHPTAEEVMGEVVRRFPRVSRATVYNTLNLFVERGLLRRFALPRGNTVFDPNVENHHHFIDETSGGVHDVPWDTIEVSGVDSLDGFHVTEFHVVMKGRKKRASSPER